MCWFPDWAESARPAGTLATADGGGLMPNLIVPNEHDSHVDAVMVPAGLIAFGTAMSGRLLASAIYWWGLINPAAIRRRFHAAHRFLLCLWCFHDP